MKLFIMILSLLPIPTQAGFSETFWLWKMFAPQTLLAAEQYLPVNGQWLCKNQSIHKSGPEYEACGVGMGKDENAARSNAFDEARDEFRKICDLDDTCRGHVTTVQPNRTDCDRDTDGRYKCLRSITFLVQPGMREKPIITSTDKFESYSYDESTPKLKVGMTKAELMQTFGKPASVTSRGDNLRFSFDNKMCLYYAAHIPCVVMIEDGKVGSWKDIKPEYSEDLQ